MLKTQSQHNVIYIQDYSPKFLTDHHIILNYLYHIKYQTNYSVLNDTHYDAFSEKKSR